jgi:hypothetical protein
MALIRARGLFGFIDRSGEFLIPTRFRESSSFVKGVAAVKSEEGAYLIDREGKPIYENLRFSEWSLFSEGLAAVNGDGLWGFIDPNLKYVIPEQKEWTGPTFFSEGLASVRFRSGSVGYIGPAGEVVIFPHRWGQAWHFCKGIAPVWIENKKGYINKAGDYIWKPTM